MIFFVDFFKILLPDIRVFTLLIKPFNSELFNFFEDKLPLLLKDKNLRCKPIFFSKSISNGFFSNNLNLTVLAVLYAFDLFDLLSDFIESNILSKSFSSIEVFINKFSLSSPIPKGNLFLIIEEPSLFLFKNVKFFHFLNNFFISLRLESNINFI